MDGTVDELFGLKVGDSVKYIANNPDSFPDRIFDLEGTVDRIMSITGEFRVVSDKLNYSVSFMRQELLLLDGNENEEEEYKGPLTEADSISLGKIRYYLKNHHNLKEGKDFSLTQRDELNEVFLKPEKFTSLLKDLIDSQSVVKALTGQEVKEFKKTIKPNFESHVFSLEFEIANWKFITHLTPWLITSVMLNHGGIDLYKEWGFRYDED